MQNTVHDFVFVAEIKPHVLATVTKQPYSDIVKRAHAAQTYMKVVTERHDSNGWKLVDQLR